jgi:hypothetical protein
MIAVVVMQISGEWCRTPVVVPAKAGTQRSAALFSKVKLPAPQLATARAAEPWTPAFAGVTTGVGQHQRHLFENSASERQQNRIR